MNLEQYYNEMTNRNIGVISQKEQNQLKNTTISIAGCGGMGGILAEQLVRMGVGHIKLADPENYETVNIGHQFTTTSSTVGENKAVVTGARLKDIYPGLNLDVFPEGITTENANEFVDNSDLVFDCIDYNQFYYSTLLHKSAIHKNLYVITPQAIGFGASVLIFDPKGMSIFDYVNIQENSPEEKIKNFQIPLEKFCPIIPGYANPEIIQKIINKEMPIANIGIAQALATSIAASEGLFILLKRRAPIVVPNFIAIDLLDLIFKTEKNAN